MDNENLQFDILDILNILSFALGLENLYENRQQSAQNNIQSANDRQAHYLIDELNKRFEEQNAMLKEILEKLSDLSV